MGKSASSKKQKAKSPEPVRDPPRESSKSPLLLTPLISVAVGIVCFIGGMYYSGPVSDNLYTVYVKSGKTHHLTHVLTTLQEAEYTRVEFNQTMNWKLMWAHDYPFVALKDKMMNLRHGQRVNKFPGTGYITNKVHLATSNIANVPPAFQIPKDKHKALAFAKEFPEKMFVIKNNDHRGVRVDKVENMNLDDAGVFVQEFVHNPLLVDGYKFDVGLYVVLTSVDPLRLYVYDEDILVRFCSEKYHPFDSSKTKQYVVFDDYLPSWELPSLAPYLENESTFQEAIKSYMRSLNKDPEEMWRQMHRTILEVYTRNEDNFIHTVNQFPHKESSYFEMVRFDFVLDENLNVYLMEVNMSPNLSSVHFPRNAKLYLKVVHGLMNLVGVLSKFDEKLGHCNSPCECSLPQCQVCNFCNHPDKAVLRAAWAEGDGHGNMRRLYPRLMTREENYLADLVGSNLKMANWYVEMCRGNVSWCK